MRILVAGATGVIGTRLAPLLIGAGHDVVGLSRSTRQRVSKLSGTTVVADALDRDELHRVVRRAAPDAVVNMLTSIPTDLSPRHLSRDFAATNRLRTEGTRNLLDAAREAGASRIISQGLAYAYDPTSRTTADEDQSLWRRAPRQFRPVLAALTELEHLTAEADGLVLRFGHLYGPGSAFAADGSVTRAVAAGKMPVVGDGGAVFSFTHVHDAATAVVAALDKDCQGALNVVDDDPAPVQAWLPELARLVGAPAPKHVPAALARLAVGDWGVAFMTRLRGADNARARLRLDWRPRYASWCDGFAAELTVGPVSVG